MGVAYGKLERQIGKVMFLKFLLWSLFHFIKKVDETFFVSDGGQFVFVDAALCLF
jgi:hypothetical protein